MYIFPTVIKHNTLIFVSHGSGGVGAGEWNIANFFLKHNYSVALVDYFSKHGINKLFWDYRLHNQDNHTISFKQMFDTVTIPNFNKVVHIGCSLGGFFGLYHARYFAANYCFYPGVVAFTDTMLKQDYSKTTVVVAEKDTWCDNFFDFYNQCAIKPLVKTVDCYHGFMIPNKNNTIPIAKYKLSATAVNDDDFAKILPNHKWLSSKYHFDAKEIVLQYDKNQSTLLLNQILKDLEKL